MIIGLVNFFENQPVIAIVILSVAFFANAFSNLGWVVWSDVIPRNFLGTMGGFLNICGNLSGSLAQLLLGLFSSARKTSSMPCGISQASPDWAY